MKHHPEQIYGKAVNQEIDGKANYQLNGFHFHGNPGKEAPQDKGCNNRAQHPYHPAVEIVACNDRKKTGQQHLGFQYDECYPGTITEQGSHCSQQDGGGIPHGSAD